MSLLIANWKMHGTTPDLLAWLSAVSSCVSQSQGAVSAMLCPPAVFLPHAQENKALISLGAQDCHTHSLGAFTGEISAQMLVESGASAIIVGHSERRQFHHETNAIVKAKCEAALKAGALPIACVGETLEEREAGATLAVVAQQLKESIPEGCSDVVIAYEPVWAIGTGRTASLEDIVSVHRAIKTIAAELQLLRDREVRVVYGGSVNPTNAASILALDEVDGALVGSASLAAESFCAILRAAPEYTVSPARVAQ